MPSPALPLLLLAAATSVAPPVVPPVASRPHVDGVEVAQLTIHQRIIIRVRRMAEQPVPDPRAPRFKPIKWKERKGPTCIAPNRVIGAMVSTTSTVDLLQDNAERVRAKLDHDCAALTYYQNFYIRPGPDGLVCADRDAIRTRSGGACTITRFKALKPER